VRQRKTDGVSAESTNKAAGFTRRDARGEMPEIALGEGEK